MPEVRFGRRPAAAVTLLALTACGPLLDLMAGTALMDTPVTVLVAVAAGFAAGAWLRPVLAALGSAVDACLLTLASQVADPGAYPVADDLFFFTMLVGGPALGGALVTARRDQVRELRRLSAVRAEQRAAQVRAARLEERNRLEAGVVQGLVQRMGALVVQASGAAREPSADETPAALDRMEESARGALTEMREVLGALRSPEAGESEDDPDLREDEATAPQASTNRSVTWADLVVGCCGAPLAFEAVVGAAARGPAWANVLVGLAVGAPLALRRRWPISSVAAMCVIGALMSATLTPLPLTVSALLPLSIAAHAVGDYTRGWRRVVGLGVVVLGVAGIVVASPPGTTDEGGVVPTLIWIGLAFGAGMVAAQHSTRAAALQTLLTSIEAGRGHEVRLAVAEQRQHVARDLHDSVAHAMTVVCLHAAAARTHRDDLELTRASLATIEETVRGGMDELRQGLDALDLVEGSTPEASLGSTDDREVTAGDLGREVGQIASTIAVTSVVDVVGEEVKLGAAVVSVARRVIREALVNVARHARPAHARVRIVAEPAHLVVEISNQAERDHGQGHGFDHGSGTGLRGLAELVHGHGGRLEHGSPTDAEFRVTAYLPTTAGVPA